MVGLVIAIVLDTAVQLLWKSAVSALPETASLTAAVAAVLHQPVFAAVGVLLACQMANWLKVLDHADLSYAQPITALSYVSVGLLSAAWLGERLGGLQILGIVFIFAGVWFIGRSGHTTPAREQHGTP